MHAILECSRLGLVGVADEVVRAHRLAGHGVPLPPGGERGAAPAEQLGVGHLADHGLRPHPDRRAKRLVSAERPVGVEARRIGDVHPPEELQGGVTCLGQRRVRCLTGAEIAGQDPLGLRRVHLSEEPFDRLLARDGDQGRRRLVAEAEAWASEPDRVVLADLDVVAVGSVVRRVACRPLQLLAHFVGALAATRDVIADVEHPLGPGNGGEQCVEGDDAVRVGGRHREPLTDVVERALADPAHGGLHGLERGKQEVPLGPRLVPSARGVGIAPLVALAAVPPRCGRAEQRVYRFALLGRGSCIQKM